MCSGKREPRPRALRVPTIRTQREILTFFGSVLELNIGLICACIPVVTPPFKALSTSLATSWKFIRNYSRTRLFIR